MNILILGSEGFIGSHCIAHFTRNGHVVSGMDLYEQPSSRYRYYKISRLSPEFDEIMRAQAFDVAVNASGSANVPYSVQHPVSDFESNCLDTIRILDAIRKHNPGCSYIHLSSAAVYGNPKKLPVAENDPVNPMSPYGWHKLVAEELCNEYSSLFGVRTAVLRPFSVYGPGLKKQLFWDLYQKAAQNKTEIELFGTGEESRDFIHVSDLITAVQCVIDNGNKTGERYNISSGIETTIASAVDIFYSALHQKPNWRFNGHTREGDPLNWKADITKLKALGFQPATALETGLTGLVSWLRSTTSIS